MTNTAEFETLENFKKLLIKKIGEMEEEKLVFSQASANKGISNT